LGLLGRGRGKGKRAESVGALKKIILDAGWQGIEGAGGWGERGKVVKIQTAAPLGNPQILKTARILTVGTSR